MSVAVRSGSRITALFTFQYRPNAPRARANRLLLDDPKVPERTGALHVRPAADLLAKITDRIHLHLLAIALAKQADRAGLPRLGHAELGVAHRQIALNL